MSPEHGPGPTPNFHAMEQEAAETIAHNQLEQQRAEEKVAAQILSDAAQEQATQDAERAKNEKYLDVLSKDQDFEERARALNDTAELEIFGSRGRTYVDEAGKTIADADNPVTGVVDAIRADHRRGKTQGERDKAAEEYVETIEAFRSAGLELFQAKRAADIADDPRYGATPQERKAVQFEYAQTVLGLGGLELSPRQIAALADGRLESRVKARELYNTLLNDDHTLTPDAAQQKVSELYSRAEDRRAKAVLTDEQYAAFLARKRPPETPKPPTPPEAPEPPEPPIDRMSPEEFRKHTLIKDPEVAQAMGNALEKYTKLSVERRKKVFKHSRKSKGLSEADVDAARAEYETARVAANKEIATSLQEAGYSDAQILLILKLNDKTEAQMIELSVKARIEQQADPASRFAGIRNKFLSLWTREAGDKFLSMKTVKRTGVMVAVGAAASAGLGLVAGGLAGGAVAGVVAKKIATGVAGAQLRRKANTKQFIHTQARAERQAQEQRIDDYYRFDAHIEDAIGAERSYGSVTTESRAGTERAVEQNRRRLLGSVAVGIAAGAGAQEAIHALDGLDVTEKVQTAFGNVRESIGDASQTLQEQVDNVPDASDVVPPSPTDVPELDETLNETFKVEKGHGIIQEISDYAEAHGKEITPEQAQRIYDHLHAEHGEDIIDLKGTSNDTYTVGNDVRLSQAGKATWFAGVEQDLLRELDDI